MTEAITSFKGEYRFLSNFWPSPFVYEGRTFPTVEHAYQCMKANTQEEYDGIINCKTPGETKKLAKKIKLRDSWDHVKFAYMRNFVECKFNQNPDLAEKLKATGDRELIEGNTWGDIYWGVCRGIGQNNLGKILMMVRKCL